eukprot:comp7265_c0_seq1/m.2969 comp7265_c0_seq1/g.2969  ORF comp7265_c0_seq1/g.2969 comp7265_c0_seq1/m.2969 type:complete len:150 (-) comp7265_c0_seq1:271-720(-)
MPFPGQFGDRDLQDRWSVLELYMDSFFWFWIFWGTLAVLFLILHMIRLCLAHRQLRMIVNLLPRPVESVYASGHNMDYQTCSICLEDFVDGDKLNWLPCLHVFHEHCIAKWISSLHVQCPVCQTNMKAPDEGTPLLNLLRAHRMRYLNV